MRFNVTVLEPRGARFAHFLYDMARTIAYTLESLGHDCSIEKNRCFSDRINILFGTHQLMRQSELDEVMGPAKDYVVMQTEIVRGLKEASGGDVRWRDMVTPLYRNALSVWESSEANLAELRAEGFDAEFFRFAFHPAMQEITHKRHRDIDFLFYGSVTKRRGAILEKLMGYGHEVRVEFDPVAIYRNDLIARSEMILTIRQSDEQAHLPQARILYGVNNRCLIVGESGLEQDKLADVFLWTDGDIVEHCRMARARKDLRELADTYHERFKSRPMTDFVAPLVARLESKLNAR